MKCDALAADNGCSRDAGPGCGNPVSPAGYLILNSFGHINSLLFQMYSAILEAYDNAYPEIHNMSQVFNPPPSGDDALSLIEEILQPVFAMAMGPEFEKVLGSLKINPIPEKEKPSDDKIKTATQEAIGNITGQLVGDGWDYIQDNVGNSE
ncbi:hypothetical protein THARTR1_05875 [Trichoderma harzianum]|uniref:Uncharacterized protein n=1 Tax=Trichoderma harzianum TaxID=5544 RepID=A0A2K0U7K7_TRIHA|nr:hypothetical protein THARTR1_05875 [Trichoderma harzianum]